MIEYNIFRSLLSMRYFKFSVFLCKIRKSNNANPISIVHRQDGLSYIHDVPPLGRFQTRPKPLI
jgi:hypothetical protein